MRKRLKISLAGQIQGVGFRPHVYRIAKQMGLSGWVCNHASGVTIEIQGESAAEFVQQLTQSLPPLARIDTIETTPIAPLESEQDFSIIKTQTGKAVTTKISPDVCVCQDCLKELFDPTGRFYHYPFLNCTNCGPRLTIVRQLPYDRCQTTMDEFPLCPHCKKDYSDPNNRRYHAQPTACSQCGPQLSMSISEIVQRITDGQILAIKGMGGYQLICDAKNEKTVANLRQRKQRDAKPFAIMTANIESLKPFVKINIEAETLLTDWTRSIVLLPKNNEQLAPSIAPNLSELGVMLPCTPIHYLLFNGFASYPNDLDWLKKFNDTVLVVTSANPSGLPLIIDDEQAHHELGKIADAIVSYNRKILTRIDDSVVRIIEKKPYFIRRARGFVPNSIKLPRALPPGLAVGGYLKNTFCITRGNEAFVSQYIGDLDNAETIDFFHETLDRLLKLLDVKPEYIAHDLHPNFHTTRFANDYGVPTFAVQHHHAHLASVAAEYHIQEPALGLALDGYGYGTNGGAWGGELMLLEGTQYHRLEHLRLLPQPGGDIAAREPWRMAAGILYLLGREDEIEQRFADQTHSASLQQILDKNINSPQTSSCGRLFDAASALLNVRHLSQYEGQAAMELESLVTQQQVLSNGWRTNNDELDLLPLMEALIEKNPIEGANLFHGTLAAAWADRIQQHAHKNNIRTIILSGGCFLNKILTNALIKQLSSKGLNVLLPKQMPPNDGGISLGQICIAGQLL